MANEDYKNFLNFIFNECIQPRIFYFPKYHPFERYDWYHDLDRLKRAVDLVNFINKHCQNSNDIYNTFKLERLRGAVDAIEDGVRCNNRLAEETGFLNAFDTYYDQIVEGLDVELFPESEYKILKELGFKDPQSDLRGIIYFLKAKKKTYPSYNELPVSQNLKNTVKKLSEAQEQFREPEEKEINKKMKPKKSRRWFKGLGQIGQGAAISIADIALAFGTLQFPVSPETQTWGSLVSATTGVGMILNGVGELRGE